MAAYEGPILLGNAPDYRGLGVAQSNRATIEAYASQNAPAIAVAAGIAVQSQWGPGLQDWAEEHVFGDTNPSQGIAQMTPSEMQKYLGGGSAFDSNLAIQAMARKIGASVGACVGCSTTDKFIVAGMAQNGFLPSDVSYVLEKYRKDGIIDWSGYFAKQEAPSGGAKNNWLALRSGGRSWNLFQLQLFLNDLMALKEKGWELPSDVNLSYLQCLTSGASQCNP